MTNPDPKLRREDYRTFKYLAGFVREWTRLGLDDDDLQELEQLILRLPESGKVIAGTGGLRKLRYSPSRWSRGKRGALRVGYAHDARLEKVLMIAVYSKAEQRDLSPRERREIKRILEKLWREETR